MAYQVGEKIQVKYLTDEWMKVAVVNIKKITPEQADKWRKYHPNIQAGEDLLICSEGLDGTGDTRAFYSLSGDVRHMDGNAESPPVDVTTREDVKPLQKIKIKRVGVH